MDSRQARPGRSSAVPLVALASLAAIATLLLLAGCSSRPSEILAPSRLAVEHVAAGAESPVILAPPPLIERWKSPRITVWTDGWRRVQGRGGVSLEPSRIYDLEIAEQQALTFHWSADPMSAQGEILGYRWAVDLEDITDETPRSGPGDVTRWSAWSATETSATVGPFEAGAGAPQSHLFFLEARDDLGFISLFTVRLSVVATSAAALEGLPVTRR
jgi:hypothetical protein